MSQAIIKENAICDSESQNQQAQISLLNDGQHLNIKRNLIAHWLLNEESKLYCKWVIE